MKPGTILYDALYGALYGALFYGALFYGTLYGCIRKEDIKTRARAGMKTES